MARMTLMLAVLPFLSTPAFCGAAAPEPKKRAAPVTRVYIKTTPPGGRVSVDGRPCGNAPPWAYANDP